MTWKDSFLEFIRYYKGRFRSGIGLLILSPVLLMYMIKLLPNWKAKQLVFAYFFKGEPLHDFDRTASAFCKQPVNAIIRKDARKALDYHLQQGHVVCVVTATPENIIGPWCSALSIQVIGTRLKTDHGKITGDFASKNCYGMEKVNRLKEVFALEEFDQIHAYGDSAGDKELLSIANHPHYREFIARN